MISHITLLIKKEKLSAEEFRAALEGAYAEKCMAVKGMYAYEQNYAFFKETTDACHDDRQADAFVIERYESLYEYEQAMSSAEHKAAVELIKGFAERYETYTCLENVSIPCRINENCKKKISLLQRTAPKVSFEDFTREWFVVHSGCMMSMPKDVFFGYNQHLVIDRSVNGEHIAYEEKPIDGILELYFSDAAAVGEAFRSTPEGRHTVSHRKEFMCGVDPFLVDFRIMKNGEN